MPRVSRYHLSNKERQLLSDQFSLLISSLRQKAEIEQFLEEFFTTEEKIMLSKRLLLYILIKQQLPPPHIQSSLHISYETVRTHAQRLPLKSFIFHTVLDTIMKQNQTKEFLKKLEGFTKPLELMFQARNDMKARAKLIPGENPPEY